MGESSPLSGAGCNRDTRDMATASQYRSAAATLAHDRDRLAGLLRHVNTDSIALTGPILRATTTALDVAHANVRTALAELDAQVCEAHRRAEVCTAYTAAVNAYFRSDDGQRQWPTRRASWVTYG